MHLKIFCKISTIGDINVLMHGKFNLGNYLTGSHFPCSKAVHLFPLDWSTASVSENGYREFKHSINVGFISVDRDFTN